MTGLDVFVHPWGRFQSTLPQGKWHFGELRKPYGRSFNPHFRKGSDKGVSLRRGGCSWFQSTLPQGKWLWSFRLRSAGLKLFQSTLPQGKWPAAGLVVDGVRGFNPHFRKGSDYVRSRGCSAFYVSIHTSAREVTPHLYHDILTHFLFQSTLPQGKWLYSRAWWCYPLHVSIHTSAREVTLRLAFATQQMLVSIHTSAREVTVMTASDYRKDGVSIHTSAREVTIQSYVSARITAFQSTLPQGKWRTRQSPLRPRKGFNPHFRKGSDTLTYDDDHVTRGFNPHFRKGSDMTNRCSYYNNMVSIHTSAREVTWYW